MKKIMLIVIAVGLIVSALLLIGNKEKNIISTPEDIIKIPDISIEECLVQIKETNPGMPDQAASDNCWTIEAINKKDKSLCGKVSDNFKPNCLAYFE